MAKHGVSLRIDDEKIKQLDRLAEVSKRDRTFIINEAIEAYLDTNKWQIEHIKASLTQADRGEFARSAICWYQGRPQWPH